MKYLSKISVFFVLILSSILQINQVQAIFHDESWQYYLQNNKTWELKYFSLEWDIWNGWFEEIYDDKIDHEKIPLKNYFNGWDLVWYTYHWRHTNYQCKWEANGLKAYVKTPYWTPNKEWNPCLQIPRVENEFSLNDLKDSDRFIYLLDFLIYILPATILGILVNFFVALPLVKYIFRVFKNSKPVYILYVAFVCSLLFQIMLFILGYSKMEIMWNQFWILINLFFSAPKFPFYVSGVIILFKEFIPYRLSYFKSNNINGFISFVWISGFFSLLFLFEIAPSALWIFDLNYPLIILFFLLLGVFLFKKKDTERYINAHYLNSKKTPPIMNKI